MKRLELLFWWSGRVSTNLAYLWSTQRLSHRLLEMTGTLTFLQQMMTSSEARMPPPAGSQAAASRRTPTCPLCSSMMVNRENRRTGEPFWGCSQFPRCRGTRQATAAAIEREQNRCDHFDEDLNKTAIKRFGNQTGSYAVCKLCSRRWKWNITRGQWDVLDEPSASAHSSLPLPGVSESRRPSTPGAAPKSAAKSRARTSRSRSDHESAAASTAAPNSDAESFHIHTDVDEDAWLLTEGSDWVGSDDAAMGDL